MKAADRIGEILRNAGRIHGSQITSLLIDEVAGRYFVDSYEAEQLIERLGLVPEDATKPDPTLSQRAFIGLQYRKHPGYVAGCKVHYWFRGPAEGAP